MSDTNVAQNKINAEIAEQDLGAWILPIHSQTSVAVGKYELKYIEYINHCVSLPGLPAFCEQGFIWRNRFIPALDIHSLITRRRLPVTDKEQLAAIIAYKNTQGDMAMGAILLQGVPKLCVVKPQQSVSLADIAPEFQRLSHAAFKEGNNFYPVLDLPALFSRTPVDLLSLH